MNRTLQSSFVLILLSSLHNASGEDQVIDAGQPPPVVTVRIHETGHLLLGRGRHAKKGLMRCPWGKRELKEAARGRLRFSPQEVRRIRGHIRDRMEARGIQVAEREAAGALVAKAAPEAMW